MQKRTLLISEIFPPKTGGSGRWFWEIYRRLPRDRYVLAVGEDTRQHEFDASHSLLTERLPLAMRQWGLRSWEGLRGYWRIVRRLRTVMQRHRVGQVHCGRCLPEGVMALAMKHWMNISYVCYVHGEDVNTASHSREHAFLTRRVLAGADYCIANSRNTAQLLIQDWRVAGGRVHLLHPGVDTGYFAPAARSESVRRTLGWGNRPVVLTVGRLQRRKGQDMLIRALPQIIQHIPDVLYAIVGDGEEKDRLHELAREQGVEDHVQFRGETADEDLVACYQQCDVFALPNREVDGDIEGFGMVLLEAQACGKPVIAGDSGGTAETMSIGVSGEILDCRTPEPLARQVVELLGDARRRGEMGERARAWVVDHFDWDALASDAARLFGDTPRLVVGGSSGQVNRAPGGIGRWAT